MVPGSLSHGPHYSMQADPILHFVCRGILHFSTSIASGIEAGGRGTGDGAGVGAGGCSCYGNDETSNKNNVFVLIKVSVLGLKFSPKPIKIIFLNLYNEIIYIPG